MKIVSLRNRKLALSRNVFCTGTSPIRMAWTLSLKYPSVKPRLLMKKGWSLEVKSHLGNHLWCLYESLNGVERTLIIFDYY